MAAAPMPTKTIALEVLLPQAIAEGWGTRELAEHGSVGHQTAARFLKRKAEQVAAESRKLVMRLSSKAGAVFQGAANRQVRRLETLEQLPDGDWTADDYRLEKHTISMLGPLIKWTQMRMDASPDDPAGDPPQLSDGL